MSEMLWLHDVIYSQTEALIRKESEFIKAISYCILNNNCKVKSFANVQSGVNVILDSRSEKVLLWSYVTSATCLTCDVRLHSQNMQVITQLELSHFNQKHGVAEGERVGKFVINF